MTELTDTQRALIQLLADGDCHSGEEIGQNLGVSRTAVWKQLQKLSDFGLEVLSLKGRGYQLTQKLDLLDPDWIVNSLSEQAKVVVGELDVPFSVDSTNNYALTKKAAHKEGKAGVCLAEFQSGGRGRRGRKWVSPLGCNLYASFLWQFEEGATALGGLSLAVGVVVARSLGRLGVSSVTLKWPNDILLEGRKVGGVLLEMTGDPAGRCQVVVGIGINVNMTGQQEGIDQPWIALKDVAPAMSRNQLAVDVIEQVVTLLASYVDTGFAAYMEDWKRLDAFAGQQVSVVSGSKTTTGIALGIAENGALLLEVNGVEQQFYGGELSVRLSEQVK